MSIKVGNNSDVLTEPFLFQTPFGKRPDRFPPEKSQPIDHHLGLQEITRVVLVSPAINPPSPEFQAALNTKQITLQEGAEYCLELGFDQETQGQTVDFRPDLPLIIHW